MRRPNYEVDDKAFPAEAYTVDGYSGVAWRVYGWELESRMNDEFDDVEEVRTGRVVCVMVGDDRRFTFEPEDLTPLNEEDYCGSCGQIGCTHDGRAR